MIRIPPTNVGGLVYMNVEHLKSRSEIIKSIRRFFDERGYLEMHTPRLVGLPGQEPHLEPFWTTVTSPSSQEGAGGVPAALITSPEYMMKRLLAQGFEKIYDLGPCFRNNEPWDGTHDPEFLLLEWYRKDTELSSLMDETEEMVKNIAKEYSEFDQPFRRLTVEDAWKEYAGVELAPLLGDRDGMAHVCRERDQTVTDEDTWDDLYFKIFLSEIEPKISPSPQEGAWGSSPTFLYRYPLSMAALARPSKDDPRWADRVELYIGGMELANGFAELADADVQRKRFEEERALRSRLRKKTWPLDEKLLADLPKMGNAVGIAFGVERFVMLLTGAASINDVIPSAARERFEGKS